MKTDRKQLQKLNEKRRTFTGEFVRFGTKKGYGGRVEQTVLLSNIVDVETGQRVTDHLWFNLTKGFARLRLKPGDCVKFDARVKGYWKGYFGHRDDVYNPAQFSHKLSHPTKLSRLTLKTAA